MKDLSVTGDVGGDIDTVAIFTVADVGHLTDFTKVRMLMLMDLSHVYRST